MNIVISPRKPFWEFWKTINLIKWKSQMTSEHKTRSRQLVKLSPEWRLKDYYSQREDFNFLLQNFRCIINILAEEVGKHHNRKKKQFLCRKENSYNFVDSFFLTLKMHKHNIYFEQRWDFVQRFKRNKKSPLYFLFRELKARNIVSNIVIGRHELAISLTTIHLVTEF